MKGNRDTIKNAESHHFFFSIQGKPAQKIGNCHDMYYHFGSNGAVAPSNFNQFSETSVRVAPT